MSLKKFALVVLLLMSSAVPGRAMTADKLQTEINNAVTSGKKVIEITETVEISTGPVEIDGKGCTISGKGERRVFNITGGTVNISNLNITGGYIKDGNGGGVRATDKATVNLTNCKIHDNIAGDSGNNVGYGGGVYANGATVNMVNCTVTGNTSPKNSGGGVSAIDATVTLINCTVTGNKTEGGGNGGGVHGDKATVNMVNCTIANNTITNVGQGGADVYVPTLNAVNTVFWNEKAQKYVSDSTDSGTLNLYNCAYGGEDALNHVTVNGKCFGELNWTGRKADEKTGVFMLTADDKDKLIDKGLTVEEAVAKLNLTDESKTLVQNALTNDQLGIKRPQGKGYDIGAVEYVDVSVTTTSLPNATVGTAYSATLTATPEGCTWSATGLPEGLKLGTDGKITGTPTAAGDFSVNVTAAYGAGLYSASAKLNLTVNAKSGPEKSSAYAPAFDPNKNENAKNAIEGFFGTGAKVVPLSPENAKIGEDRTAEDLPPEQLNEVSNDHSVILVVLPVITPGETAVYVMGASYDVRPDGTLAGHSFPDDTENNAVLTAADDVWLFLKDDGTETTTAPNNGHVNAAVMLTKNVTYAPVITAETSPDVKGGSSPSGGCDVGFGFMVFAFALPAVLVKRR